MFFQNEASTKRVPTPWLATSLGRPGGKKNRGRRNPFFFSGPGPSGGQLCYPLHKEDHGTKSATFPYRDRVCIDGFP